jgi:hypothetical protein
VNDNKNILKKSETRVHEERFKSKAADWVPYLNVFSANEDQGNEVSSPMEEWLRNRLLWLTPITKHTNPMLDFETGSPG